MKKILLCVWIGIISNLPLFAQNDESAGSQEVRGRSAWFVYTSMPEGLENPVSIMTGDDIVEVTLSKRSASNPVKIPADGILKLVRKVEDPKEPGKIAYLTLAQALVPDDVNKALIIFVPAAKNASGLLFQPRVRDLEKFKNGNSMYLNMTNLKVGIELGDTEILVNPGEDKIQKFDQVTQPTNVAIRYSYYHPEKKEWKILSASTIVIYPTRREICIFSWDPRYERMDYHGITLPEM